MISIAYPGAMKYYYKTIRELPAGWGFADVIFIPKKASASLSAIAMEVKLESKIFKLIIVFLEKNAKIHLYITLTLANFGATFFLPDF